MKLKVGDKVQINFPFESDGYPNGTVLVEGIDITPSMLTKIDKDAVYTVEYITDNESCKLKEIPYVIWPNSVFKKAKSENLEYIESVIPMYDINFMRKTNNSNRTWFREFALAVSLPDDDDKINSTHIVIIQVTGDKKSDRVAVIGVFPSIKSRYVLLCDLEDVHQTILDMATKYVKGDVKVELLLIDKNNLNL